MTTAEWMLDLVTRKWARLRDTYQLGRLNKLGRLGDPPVWNGLPYLELDGRIEIGRAFRLQSVPVQSHLVVHRRSHLQIGDRVSMSFGCGIACHSRITIGDDSHFGPYVMILDSDYHVAGDPKARAIPLPIEIGRGVRVGARTNILRGTRIGDGAVIDAGSVVIGEIPSGAHVAGVPARDVAEVQLTRAASVIQSVLHIAQQTFRLAELPAPSDGPAQLARWDSLGALSFLLALEAVFEVSLNVDEAAGVRSLEAAARLVSNTLEQRDAALPARSDETSPQAGAAALKRIA